MSTIRVRITAEEIEAKRIYELLARDFEDDGNPVTVFESSADGLQWTAEILLFEMTPDEATDLVRDRLGADEAALKVGVDDARRLRRAGASVHRPRAHLLVASCEKVNQVELVIALLDRLANGA